VVFVDWHGVLSDEPFWSSIRRDPQHHLRPRLETKLGEIFSSGTVHDWMKGLLTSDDIVADMGLRLDKRFRDDYLLRKLDQDIRRMQVNVELFAALRSFKSYATVVLATDNMDCFARTFAATLAKARRPSDTAETLAAWATVCDDYICSSEVGALKADDPVGFFGPWLSDAGLDFRDALLIDDRADNCAAFEALGGSTVRWRMGQNDISEVATAVRAWLQLGARADPAPDGLSW
jgi:hypothetical protein